MKEVARIARMLLKVLLLFYLPLMTASVLLNYPYNTDPSIGGSDPPRPKAEAQSFYDRVYSPPDNRAQGNPYIETENATAEESGIELAIQHFVEGFQLKDKKVLEVGSGTGSLQDLVEDYTGLDISPNVAGLYHKRFVLGSATALPFPDNSFDASWTVWVLEHVPEPERMLAELRRVVKPQGLLYLCPAWNCVPWAATGYETRPYGDFGLGGKIAKSVIPLRKFSAVIARTPIRLIRSAQYRMQGARARLRFRALTPNYEHFWIRDSDAAVSLDSEEAYQWFRSRGDQCLNCSGGFPSDGTPKPLVIRIRKADNTN